MAIIDPKGLFLGDRLAMCSDTAKLHWPWMYAAANNYARLELNYRKVVSTAYTNFQMPPTELEFWKLITEYRNRFLLFVYTTAEGVVWGQWQTNERYLLGKKNAEDRRSPTPPADEQENYRKRYLDYKISKSVKNQQLADLGADVPQCAELGAMVESGSAGVGVGVGEEQIQKQKQEQKPREKRAIEFVLPEWVPVDSWNAYLAMRKAKRSPATAFAGKLVVLELEKLRKQGHDPAAVLDQSVRNSWTDVWPLKENKQGGNNGKPEYSKARTSGNASALEEVLQRQRDRAAADEAVLCETSIDRPEQPGLLLAGVVDAEL